MDAIQHLKDYESSICVKRKVDCFLVQLHEEKRVLMVGISEGS